MNSVKDAPLVEVEHIKQRSDFLRGTLQQSLANRITGALAEDDTQLSKFHGIYQQDNRDIRGERRKQMLEPAYSFMIRARVPAGICSPEQWLAFDKIACERANGTLRLTTRQAFQLHGVIKGQLKPAIADINHSLMDTIAACGDVNRNVMCSVNPELSSVHAEAYSWAAKISEHLTPNTTAYHEIWMDGKRVAGGEADHEPIYGNTYLPRKFKTAVVVPPSNDVDVFANDLGFIAIVEAGKLTGFNVTVGGGMGTTHGDEATYPRLADVIGFCRPEQVLQVAEHVVTTQRDFGDRTNRKHARLKYTIEDRGIDWFKAEVGNRLGAALEPAREVEFTHNGDQYGWSKLDNGDWHYTLFVENGRIADLPGQNLLTGLREIASVHTGDFRITPNQSLVIGNIAVEQKEAIETLLHKHGLDNRAGKLRQNSMACVAMPTCALAMAESERYLPGLIDKIEALLAQNGLADDAITLRMTGCPNGCARPFIAEIGFVGKAPGRYNLYLGGGFYGQRLNKLYRENINEAEILNALEPLISEYADRREESERFGDFLIRVGFVKEVTAGSNFHA